MFRLFGIVTLIAFFGDITHAFWFPKCTVNVSYQLNDPLTGTDDPEYPEIGNTDLVPIDGTLPFKILIHGLGDETRFWYNDAISSYLSVEEVNVITVYWSASHCNSLEIAHKVPSLVAKNVTELIEELVRNLEIPLEDVHLVGFSLGAHIAGFVGQFIQNSLNGKLGRITGLDPTGIAFYLASDCRKLSKNDAAFVDVIHTDAGIVGYLWCEGHADFYPNGGHRQNGCGILSIGCNHNRAAEYFVESIGSKRFVATKCSTYTFYKTGFCRRNEVAVMGENSDNNASGIYFLDTNSKHPFAKGS